MDRAVVFDLGGTLMEFVGMPLSWTGYYSAGLGHVNEKYGLGLTDAQIGRAVQIMTEFNPRVRYRENEIAPEVIFEAALKSCRIEIPIEDIISAFFEGIDLKPKIYDYSFSLIEDFRKAGFGVACLTDLPSAMPDAYFREKIRPLLERIPLYVSSQSCGYRKPNPHGLIVIARHFRIGTDRLLLIGDEEKDALTAERAGCAFEDIRTLAENGFSIAGFV